MLRVESCCPIEQTREKWSINVRQGGQRSNKTK